MEEEAKNVSSEETEDAAEQDASAETVQTEEAKKQEPEPENSGAAEADNASDGNSANTAEEKKAEEQEKKKGFFSKKKDKKDEQIEELTDRNRRLMAEFDNYRKRTEKEKSAMFEVGARSIIEKILPVVDNFERGLAAVPEEQRDTPVAQGMEKIYKQMTAVLEEMGVKPIEAVGQTFDPNLHNAVMHTEDESLGENIVAQEFQKGYTYRDSVVRHSMVQVAN